MVQNENYTFNFHHITLAISGVDRKKRAKSVNQPAGPHAATIHCTPLGCGGGGGGG